MARNAGDRFGVHVADCKPSVELASLACKNHIPQDGLQFPCYCSKEFDLGLLNQLLPQSILGFND